MTLKILHLNLVAGLTPLGAQQTISLSSPQPTGRRCAKRIERTDGGFMVEWPTGKEGETKLFFIPSSQVTCAEIEETAVQAPTINRSTLQPNQPPPRPPVKT